MTVTRSERWRELVSKAVGFTPRNLAEQIEQIIMRAEKTRTRKYYEMQTPDRMWVDGVYQTHALDCLNHYEYEATIKGCIRVKLSYAGSGCWRLVSARLASKSEPKRGKFTFIKQGA